MKVSDTAAAGRKKAAPRCAAATLLPPSLLFAVLLAMYATGTPLISKRAHVGMDLDCGNAPGPFSETLPNALFIGDSIANGYGPRLLELLDGEVALQHCGGVDSLADVNGGNTRKGLRCLDAWLGAGTWDLVHFNHGLWDMVDREHTRWWRAFPAVKKKTWREQMAVPLDEYRRNIETYVDILNASARRIMFATTTPVPRCVPDCTNKHKRSNEKTLQYNAAALAALPAGVLVDDIYAAAVGYCGDPFPSNGCAAVPTLAKGDIHFTDAGSANLAINVSRAIRRALGITR